MLQGELNLPVHNNIEANIRSCCSGATGWLSTPVASGNIKCRGRTEVGWSCVDLKLMWGIIGIRLCSVCLVLPRATTLLAVHAPAISGGQRQGGCTRCRLSGCLLRC